MKQDVTSLLLNILDVTNDSMEWLRGDPARLADPESVKLSVTSEVELNWAVINRQRADESVGQISAHWLKYLTGTEGHFL